MRTKALPIAAAAAAFALLVSAQTGSSQPRNDDAYVAGSTKRVRVLVQDNFFDPRSIQVQAGGKVVWRWKGVNRHNVRFTKVPKGATRRGSKTQTEGYWKRRFHVQGVYRYVCTLFAGMRGTVTVVPPPAD
jgi:plastocyanin